VPWSPKLRIFPSDIERLVKLKKITRNLWVGCADPPPRHGYSGGLRVSRPLIWHILDKISTKQGFNDIIQISHFVELVFNLQKKYAKRFVWPHSFTYKGHKSHLSQNGKSISSQVLFWNKPKFQHNVYN
jgi:hypothetical protein